MFGGTACMEDYLGKYSQDSQRNNASLNEYSAFVSASSSLERQHVCFLKGLRSAFNAYALGAIAEVAILIHILE
ncbi:hypothetical protein ZIOFF_022058 [Zingiber officinale]|uniref:Uncharacterized protein n=1 Tax=Zingiber officinale TaxID=94328 RepID=A0A8J5H2A7_ZINOF|nr:hypothetical protein ZIOFF_022058 [Zingiber officinale]